MSLKQLNKYQTQALMQLIMGLITDEDYDSIIISIRTERLYIAQSCIYLNTNYKGGVTV